MNGAVETHWEEKQQNFLITQKSRRFPSAACFAFIKFCGEKRSWQRTGSYFVLGPIHKERESLYMWCISKGVMIQSRSLWCIGHAEATIEIFTVSSSENIIMEN